MLDGHLPMQKNKDLNMTQEQIYDIIKNALAESDDDQDSEEGWDSMAQISVLIALDSAFEGKIAKIEKMQSVSSVDEVMAILRENGLVK